MVAHAVMRAGEWFSRVSNTGVATAPSGQARVIQGANHVFLLSALMQTPVAVLIAVAAWPQTLAPAISHVAMMTTWLVAIFVTGRGLHALANTLGVVVPLIQFAYLAILFSSDARFELQMVLVGGLVYIVFLPGRWRWGLLTSGLGVLAASILVMVPATDVPRVDLPGWWIPAVATYNLVLVAAFLFLVGLFNHGYFQHERRRNALLLQEAHSLAVTDMLTGLYNRRGIEPELQSAQVTGDYALAIVDVDRFKEVNDRLGHQVGDEVLGDVARLLRDSLPAHAAIARWGGEEFLVIILAVGLPGALSALERARAAVDHDFTVDGQTEHVTISAGVVRVDRPGSVDAALRLADAQLYEAKREGRNTVRGVALKESVVAPAPTPGV
ncbi:GGDEF domain-containing protein [Demequina capsici]|uniref:GGDEF domain-containing protein n=1 Tax=Demequina capsici TaxID=3075620 RepID=A0AA96J691_9MICO|nr:GGDEF domain-containing protein [Demequina sp. OYTSA14]WNM23982.1 GGDEF domain-containing protein [Demequina sp. OYTSA14]